MKCPLDVLFYVSKNSQLSWELKDANVEKNAQLASLLLLLLLV